MMISWKVAFLWMMASGKKSEWKTPRFLSPVSLEHPLESAEANDLFSFFFSSLKVRGKASIYNL